MNDIHKMMQQHADILKEISTPNDIAQMAKAIDVEALSKALSPMNDFAQMAKANVEAFNKSSFIETIRLIGNQKAFADTSLQNSIHAATNNMSAIASSINAGAFMKEEMSITKQLHQVSALAVVKLPKVEFPSIAADYMRAMNMAIQETRVFDHLKLPGVGIANMALESTALKHHTDMFQNLLKPLSYLEECVKKMNIAVIGRDALHITAFSAIHAVETQFRFFQQDTTLEESFSKTPLYSSLNQFSDLNLEDFETEEDWHDAFLDKIQAFLGTTIDNSQEYAFSFIRYIAKKYLELLSIALTVYFYTQSPSLQDVQEIGQKVDDVRRTQIEEQDQRLTKNEEQDQRLTKMEEQDQRLTKKIDSILELLEKSNNPPMEESLSSEAQALYYTINDVEVKSEPSTTASSIAALAIDESINVIEKQNDEWVQIEFFDYIHWEIRKGWIQTHDVEPLVLRTEEDANPIDEVATPSTQQLAEASNRIHNRYAKTFQRLAKE